MIPMVVGSMGMKRIVDQIVNDFGYRRVLVASTLALALLCLLFIGSAMLGWYGLLPVLLFFQGMINAMRFSSMNTLILKDLPDTLASSGNSLLSMVMQLAMSIGVSIAGLLLGMFSHSTSVSNSGILPDIFIYTYSSMALIIALPALVFLRVPSDSTKNFNLTQRNRNQP